MLKIIDAGSMNIRVQDFTESRWGYKMHAETWSHIPPAKRTFWQRIFGAPDSPHRRYSFLAHCPDPRIGDDVIYLSESGRMVARIYDLENLGNPRDMWKIFVEVLGGENEPAT